MTNLFYLIQVAIQADLEKKIIKLINDFRQENGDKGPISGRLTNKKLLVKKQNTIWWFTADSFFCFVDFFVFRLIFSWFAHRICTQLCRGSTLKESTSRRRWRAVFCTEATFTLLSTGSASTLKMVTKLYSCIYKTPYSNKAVETGFLNILCVFYQRSCQMVLANRCRKRSRKPGQGSSLPLSRNLQPWVSHYPATPTKKTPGLVI